MGSSGAGPKAVTALLCVVGGLMPLLLHWLFVGRAPLVAPELAREWLSAAGARAVLVDVRSAGEHAAGHPEGARPWPFEQIRSLDSPAQVPADLRGRRLLLICSSGIRSAMAALRLQAAGVPDVVSVAGGIEAWVASAAGPCAFPLCTSRAVSGHLSDPAFRDSPAFEQWAAVVSGFAVKPLYTLLSLLIVIWLRRARSPDLAAVRWAMLSFFVGENFCALNALVYGEGSTLLEHFHSLGMVVSFGLMGFALLEGIDMRFLKLSDGDARCAVLNLCQRCIKGAEVPCGLERTFRFLLPAAAVLAAMPLFAHPVSVSYNTSILGTYYNYSHAGVQQLYEIRYLPVVAMALFAASLVALIWQGARRLLWPKILLSAGAGALGFSLFRWILFAAYQPDLVWFAFWEEVTELIFVAATAFTLWAFRQGLFPVRQ